MALHAGAGEDGSALRRDMAGELSHDPGLPDARLAQDQCTAKATFQSLLKDRREFRRLRFTSYEHTKTSHSPLTMRVATILLAIILPTRLSCHHACGNPVRKNDYAI